MTILPPPNPSQPCAREGIPDSAYGDVNPVVISTEWALKAGEFTVAVPLILMISITGDGSGANQRGRRQIICTLRVYSQESLSHAALATDLSR